MQIFYAVIDDIYSFTIGTIVRFFSDDEQTHAALLLGPRQPVPALLEKNSEAIGVLRKEITQDTFRGIDAIMQDRASVGTIARSVMYVGSARAPVFINPTKEFDTVTFELPYGTMTMVLEEKGRFARVSVDGREGWTLRDDLLDRAAFVYPEFTIGNENEADNPNTYRLRAFIGDLFHGDEADFSLQAGEYVYYKLMRRGLSIPWPQVYPRTPGRWHIILKSVPSASIGVIPKVGSIMEYTQPNETGHLAYVDAVFPDESIVLSEANYPDRGIYNERTLTKEEWTAQNPVFIQVA